MSVVGKHGYKETVIGWIPSDWQIRAVGEICDVQGGKRLPKGEVLTEEDTGFPYIRVTDMRMGRVNRKGILYVPAHVQPSISQYTISKDDIFISVAGTLGIVGVIPACLEGANLTENADKLTNIKICRDYLSCVLRSDQIQSAIQREGTTSAQPKLALGRIREFVIPVPSEGEQQKIAAILATVDDKLDVISRQIDAIQTIKQGLMQTLFSRGVGTPDAAGRWVPHSEFKDSELGEIPVGWEVKALEALADSITVGIATSTTEHYVEDGVPLIRNQNIKEDFLDMSDLLKISEAFDRKNKSKRVQEGDVLTVRTGYPGVSCVVPEGLGYLQTFTTLITRPNQKLISPHYVSRYFNSPQGKGLMLHQAAGGAQQNINAGNLKKLLVPVPSLAEQRKIAEILAAADAKGRSLASKKGEYQTLKRGLMQKLLTGEWRVTLGTRQEIVIAA